MTSWQLVRLSAHPPARERRFPGGSADKQADPSVARRADRSVVRKAAGQGPARQAIRSAKTPATSTRVPSARCIPNRSLSSHTPSTAANSTEVSRSAATEATGARVIAHKAIAYEPIDAAPPRVATGQRPRA